MFWSLLFGCLNTVASVFDKGDSHGFVNNVQNIITSKNQQNNI